MAASNLDFSKPKHLPKRVSQNRSQHYFQKLLSYPFSYKESRRRFDKDKRVRGARAENSKTEKGDSSIEQEHGDNTQQWLQNAHHRSGRVAYGRQGHQKSSHQRHQDRLSPLRLRW